MPKKFVGENSKAVAARARKAAAKEAENTKKALEAEEKAWKDDDKQLLKKKQRQEELEKKRQQQLEKKAEVKALLEKEMATIKVGGKQPAAKITRAEIVAVTEKRNQAATTKKKEEEKPIEENLNRLTIEGETAHGIDEALSVLSTKDPEIDRHPEKRVKAAFASFEERMMPIIKEQNPTLRLSQLKQILKKEWMKSPENPLNQKLLLNR
ncbi:coiled-coil domain-containing protein 124 [Megachile rotundata]|uniref:coiled-coil domain-containing protein 124 n=1 Tax=Megachile rotundata TaxID=143995 RepID=UPI000258DA95|nr:PREDICTED: coiled-coil domain-containing protein 124 [Megachile rotundata]